MFFFNFIFYLFILKSKNTEDNLTEVIIDDENGGATNRTLEKYIIGPTDSPLPYVIVNKPITRN